MQSYPLRLVQISDLHVFADEKKTLLGVNTQESFQAVVDLLQAEADNIDLIVISGDLSQDGSDIAYRRITNTLKPLAIPVYYIPGNHDHADVMTRVYPKGMISNDRHLILGNWHIILLDSQKPKAVEGYLDQKQLDYLEHCLQAYPTHHAVVIFHHQPLLVGCQWLDNLGLRNAKVFWDVITQYETVKAVLFGHVHQEFAQLLRGVQCYSAPSTCFQFKRQQNQFGLEKLPPGFRWLHLYEKGRLEAGIKRVTEYVGLFEAEAKGY